MPAGAKHLENLNFHYHTVHTGGPLGEGYSEPAGSVSGVPESFFLPCSDAKNVSSFSLSLPLASTHRNVVGAECDTVTDGSWDGKCRRAVLLRNGGESV